MKMFKVFVSLPNGHGNSLEIQTLECDHLHVTEQGVLVATRDTLNTKDDDDTGETMVRMYAARHWLSVEPT